MPGQSAGGETKQWQDPLKRYRVAVELTNSWRVPDFVRRLAAAQTCIAKT
jgi:hypothetical protein